MSLPDRFFVKNKSLYPLMKDRQVMFFTLVDGSLIRGLIDGFSRYEIRMSLKGGVPLTLLRYAVNDLRDKAGNCYLKSVDQEKQSWKARGFPGLILLACEKSNIFKVHAGRDAVEGCPFF